MVHWIDEISARVVRVARERGLSHAVVNGGLSVSGKQHVGRLRGEILLSEQVGKALSREGISVTQYVTLYTQDPWKGTKDQVRVFRDRSLALSYVGRPLITVPDPFECHDNWVDHYWEDFGPYIEEFSGGEVRVVTTTELYRGGLREFTLREVLPKRSLVVRVLNKYRGRNPYPDDWIPVQPTCGKCGRIDSTRALRLEGGGEYVRYRCGFCGHEGSSSIESGKLSWRIEWVGVWWALKVFYEPYGKDHAIPGGSRDSCADLAVNVFNFEPPEGDWFEWVALRSDGMEADMSSSAFYGLTPREWLEVAHPQILRFIYYSTRPQRRIVVDPSMIPLYYSSYYRAERAFFGEEEDPDGSMAKSYEMSQLRGPPPHRPSQPPYTHVALLVQIIPRELLPGEALKRLSSAGLLKLEDEYSVSWAEGLVYKALEWSRKYAPEKFRLEIPETIPREVLEEVRYRRELRLLSDRLSSLEEWNEESLKELLVDFGRGMSNEERKAFYRDFYRVLIGRPEGPRAAPLLAVLPKDFVIARLRLPSELD